MPDSEYKIHFVCKGNTFRSPLAEVICRKMIREKGLTKIQVSSSGVVAKNNHNGPITWMSLRLMKNNHLLDFFENSGWTQTTNKFLNQQDLIVFLNYNVSDIAQNDLKFTKGNFIIRNIPDLYKNLIEKETNSPLERDFQMIKLSERIYNKITKLIEFLLNSGLLEQKSLVFQNKILDKVPTEKIIGIYSSIEEIKGNRPSLTEMFKKYSWFGPELIKGSELLNIELWNPTKKPKNTFIEVLSNKYTEYTAAKYSYNYLKNRKELQNKFPRDYSYIENLIKLIEQEEPLPPIFILNKPYEKNNRQLIDGLHRIVAYLASEKSSHLSNYPGLPFYLGTKKKL